MMARKSKPVADDEQAEQLAQEDPPPKARKRSAKTRAQETAASSSKHERTDPSPAGKGETEVLAEEADTEPDTKGLAKAAKKRRNDQRRQKKERADTTKPEEADTATPPKKRGAKEAKGASEGAVGAHDDESDTKPLVSPKKQGALRRLKSTAALASPDLEDDNEV